MKQILVLLALIPTMGLAAATAKISKKSSAPLMVGQTLEELGIDRSELKPVTLGKDWNEPFTDLPMRYPTYSHPAADQQTAMAVYDRGRPIVLYGPRAAKKLDAHVMGAILQHEYCHHDLHHRGQSSASMEAQADCCGSYHLEDYERHDLVEFITDFTDQAGCSYDAKTPISQVNEDHPCGQQRAYVYNFCASNKALQLTQDFLDSELPLETHSKKDQE